RLASFLACHRGVFLGGLPQSFVSVTCPESEQSSTISEREFLGLNGLELTGCALLRRRRVGNDVARSARATRAARLAKVGTFGVADAGTFARMEWIATCFWRSLET